jgi:hypothetical protein
VTVAAAAQRELAAAWPGLARPTLHPSCCLQPCLCLSATAPLLQSWLPARTHVKEALEQLQQVHPSGE